MKKQPQHLKLPSLRAINTALSVLVAFLAVYITLTPFLPQITWWVRHDAPVVSGLTGDHDARELIAEVKQEPVPMDRNELILPALGLRETILGGDISSLSKGVWRLPHTSAPDAGGNTVLVGHRFTYSGQSVFYHLDKVREGDTVRLHWGGKVHNYTVIRIMTVPATEISIEANTDEPLLTIYTCTPLWSAKDRLVIQAKPVEETP